MAFRHRIISAGLVVALAGPACLVTAPATVALADPVSDLAAAAAQLESLGAELSSLQGQLAETTDQLEASDFAVAEKQAQIEQTQQDLSEKQAVLGENMRNSYKTGAGTILDYVLGSTSAEELVSRIYYLDKVSQQQSAAISEVRDLEAQLEQEKSELEQQQATLQQQVQTMQQQVSDYEGRVAEATSYYDSLDAEVQAQLAAEAAASENVSTAVDAVENNRDQGNNAAGGVSDGSSSSDTGSSNEAPGDAGSSNDAPDAGNDAGSSSSGSTDSGSSNSGGSSSGGSSSGSGSSVGGGGVATALAQVGKPYVWGATGPNSFDCSGLVCYSYGYARGRTTYSMISSIQASGGWKTSIDQLSYGDLVFTSGGGHVGIYVGNGQMVHAASPGVGVIVGAIYGFMGGGSYY